MPESTYKGILFDLDGVLVDTARYHYLAWKKLALQWDLELTPEANEELKGVSRVNSLHWILKKANVSLTDEGFKRAMEQKNQDYLSYIAKMDSGDLLRGALDFLKDCQRQGYRMALASASKNAPLIIEKLGIHHFFDAIADGNSTTKSKPDPDVFLIAASSIGIDPTQCVAIEDSQKGIQAANNAGCYTVGIGEKEVLTEANTVYKGLYEFRINDLEIEHT